MALTVCCVDAGNYLGQGGRYVDNLFRAVRRNLSQPHQFVCFTDHTWGLNEDVWAQTLPHPGLDGWMNKLSLFKPGVFADGERVLYLDLDTVITGSLDEIASYAGAFAMLEDVIYLDRLGSGVMAWRGGFGANIFQSYLAAGCPTVAGGDQVWIAEHVSRPDRLQDLYPNQIASYKMSAEVLSPQTRIVAFHGSPRPHEVSTGWVPALWASTPQQKDTQ